MNNATRLLLLLIQQATILQPQTPKAVEMLYHRHFRQHSVPSFDEVRVAFEESIRAFHEICILIDGLDESDNFLEPFFDMLGSLITSFRNLKILVTSRPVPSIMRSSIFHDKLISFPVQSFAEELQLFLGRELESRHFKRLLESDNLRQKVEENILKKANALYV